MFGQTPKCRTKRGYRVRNCPKETYSAPLHYEMCHPKSRMERRADLLTGRCCHSKSRCRGNGEKLPGERGLWVGEAGRNCRGNRNTAGGVRTNSGRCNPVFRPVVLFCSRVSLFLYRNNTNGRVAENPLAPCAFKSKNLARLLSQRYKNICTNASVWPDF